jgi:hypothetical protein
MGFLDVFWQTLFSTVWDVLPVAVLLVVFQLLVLRESIANWQRLVIGFGFVLVGLTLFLVGLETALFPLGKIMARQLTEPAFIFGTDVAPSETHWWSYGWVYLFAALIGFSTTIAEPALIAVAYKAHEVSRGGISQWGLRLAVALGVAIGITLGTFRIVTGTPLYAYIIAAYVVVVIQTVFAPRMIIPLAYDSGGVTTSTVTVPLVTALGLGLAAAIPDRNPVLDGFGLIAFASVFPIMTVLGYARIVEWWTNLRQRSLREEQHAVQDNRGNGKD